MGTAYAPGLAVPFKRNSRDAGRTVGCGLARVVSVALTRRGEGYWAMFVAQDAVPEEATFRYTDYVSCSVLEMPYHGHPNRRVRAKNVGAVLPLAAVYACGKTVGQRGISSRRSCRTKLKRKRWRNADASASSSTTCIVPKNMPLPDAVDNRPYLAGHYENGEAQESRRQPCGPPHGSCLRDSSMARWHPPRFIGQRADKSRKIADSSTVRDVDGSSCEGDDQMELKLSSTFPAKLVADPRATLPRRTFKGQRLRSRACRTTGAEVAYDERDEGNFKTMHGLGFQDEQARSIKNKLQVVVTVKVPEPRNLGESPNSCPIVPPWTRDLPQPKFMKDSHRSHSLRARLSDSLCSITGSLASAEVLFVDGAAVNCDAAQVTPGEAAPKKALTFSKTFPSDDGEAANTARAQDSNNPLKISSTNMRHSSSHSSISDEKLDTATIDISSKPASRTDSGVAVVTADVTKTSSDVASTYVMPYGRIMVSFTNMKSASTDCDDTSREAARALLVFSDSDEGSIPPSGSMSLSFVSSNSSSDPVYRLTDLADLPRLQNNVAAANYETGDGIVVLRLQLPRLPSSATQTESSRQPASSLIPSAALRRRNFLSGRVVLAGRSF
ncbi:hypothetical protein HPB50_005540 [Hyalomma asiaticum]|uniref:Uncharacterized protein n=1 Tax=Hyalomma asiaticum TaxID=266040 RepID=A0ACB7RY20_HYAAI|nr:hypothetical protein HPB50_005540 [Hyalomma asiaticum]